MAATKKSKQERAQEVWNANEYLKTLRAQIPEDKQAEVFEHLGEHVLRQDEFSRLSDEAKATSEAATAAKAAADSRTSELNAWYAEAVKKVAALEAKAAAPPDPPAFDASKYLTKDEAAKITAEARNQVEAQSLALQEAIDEVKARHFKTFGEWLPSKDLIAHARKVGKPVDAAYQDMVAERLVEKAKKDDETRVAVMRAEIEKDVRSKMGVGFPYPTHSEPSTIAGLAPTKDTQYGVKAAVDAMLRGDVKF